MIYHFNKWIIICWMVFYEKKQRGIRMCCTSSVQMTKFWKGDWDVAAKYDRFGYLLPSRLYPG